ncbi:diguanylate cyclase (GGDEF)-like protein [Candidatus Fervidibacter sacchari]|uniref:Diguanylate cyclase (GGDEF)-like protein n=1 Tax=Candidatus Fervidibacter sacchari TaxID=1448929 RepID=A0ABT2EJC8_9BACT|nr:diguanylate cyclase (GGDEF)-like protein [Candidatus Fervidibacter sacchari]
MRATVRTLAILSLIWLTLCAANIWLILKSTQSVGLALLSTLAILVLGGLATTLIALFQRINLFDEQQKRLESLPSEWQATQESLRQLLSQRDQLGLLVQLLHHFVLATTRQDILLALLRELPPFLWLDKMEVVAFDGTVIYGVWDAISGQIRVEEMSSQGEVKLPSWAREKTSRSISQTFDALLVPVVTDESVIALMRLTRSREKPFSTDELRFLEAVANQTALALERVKLIAFLENLSITDALTGIANRRHFEWRLSEEVERARRYKYPLSALLLDLDHFKQVNDNYGHQIGDIVLQQVAQRLKSSLRRTDFLARYGGEEFVVLAPQTPAERAVILGERLRQVIAESPITVADDL